MKKKETDETVKKSNLAWPIALGVICLVLSAGGYSYARYTMNDRASLLIYSLILAAVVWGILHLSVGLKKGSIKSTFSFIAIFVSLVVSMLYGYSLFLIEEERVFEEKKQTKALAAAKQAPPPSVEKAVNATQAKTGDPGEFEGFAAAFTNKSAADRTEYLREMDAAGWSKILDAGRVGQDKTLTESKAILQKARDIVGQYRTKHLALVDDALKDIATLKISEPSRQKILHSFDSTSPNSHESIGALWDYEAKIISQYDGIFALLSAKKGTWSADNGRILFTSKADLDAFNAHLDAIQDLSQKGEAIRQQQREAVGNTFNEPKTTDPKNNEPKVVDPKTNEPTAGEPKANQPKFGDPTINGPKK